MANLLQIGCLPSADKTKEIKESEWEENLTKTIFLFV